MLQATLEEHGKCQLVGIRGDVRMLRVAEGTRGIVHRANDITREGQRGIVAGSLLREVRHVVVPLGTIDALGGKQIRISALPSARDWGTVEVHQ